MDQGPEQSGPFFVGHSTLYSKEARMRASLAGTMLAAAGLVGCTTLDDAPLDPVGEARLTYANGLPAGTATLLNDARGLRIAVSATGMTPGAHGFHLHTTGKCEAPGFTSAGGHLNPDNRRHGTMAAGGAHLGDLPNLQIGSNGVGSTTEAVPGGGGALGAIFDGDGTAVVIHASPDDYRTDPTGNAGDRVACGVLSRTG
jgi:Cu-Zn family superoxide dismutase